MYRLKAGAIEVLLVHPGGPFWQHKDDVEGDSDPALLHSNTFQMEWPPKSGTMREFPEIDRAAWFNLAVARRKIVPGQRGFLDQLEKRT
jgi:predicted NUDIX family NTP pyrophosphohydrolase